MLTVDDEFEIRLTFPATGEDLGDWDQHCGDLLDVRESDPNTLALIIRNYLIDNPDSAERIVKGALGDDLVTISVHSVNAE
jgi:hypothetical protein